MPKKTITTLDDEISLLEVYLKILLKIKDYTRKRFPKLFRISKDARSQDAIDSFIEVLDRTKNEDQKLRWATETESICRTEVRKVYGFYREELGLKDCSVFLSWPFIFEEGLDRNPIYIITDLIDRLRVLKYRQERDKIGQGKDTETPASQAEKEAAPWWKKVGRYFVRNHKWLIAAIIVPIVTPIIVLLVTKKLGN